jgi:hypothetical protein
MSTVDRHSVAEGRRGFRVRLLRQSMSRLSFRARQQQLPRPWNRSRRYGFFPMPRVRLLLLLLQPSVSMTPSSRQPQARQRAWRYLLLKFVSFRMHRSPLHQRLSLVFGWTTSWLPRLQARRRVQALRLQRYGFCRARAPQMFLAQHQSPRSGLLLAQLRQPLRRSSRRRTFSSPRSQAPQPLLLLRQFQRYGFSPAQPAQLPLRRLRRSSRRLMRRSSLRLPAASLLRRHRFRQSRFFPARQQQPHLRRFLRDGLMTRFSHLRLLLRAVPQRLSPSSGSCQGLRVRMPRLLHRTGESTTPCKRRSQVLLPQPSRRLRMLRFLQERHQRQAPLRPLFPRSEFFQERAPRPRALRLPRERSMTPCKPRLPAAFPVLQRQLRRFASFPEREVRQDRPRHLFRRSESCRVLPAEQEVRPFRSSPRGRAPSSFPLQLRGQQALLHRFRASPSFRVLPLEPSRPQFRLWRFSFSRLLPLQRAPGLFLRSTSQSKSRSLSRLPPPRLRLSPRSTSSPSTTSTYRLQAGVRGTDVPWRSSSTRDPLAGVVSEPRRQPASTYRHRGK